MLAWLSREQAGGMSVSHIMGPTGEPVFSPEGINQCFAEYYRTLYSSRADYRDEDLTTYLEDIDILVLTPTYHKQLNAPITVTESNRLLSPCSLVRLRGLMEFL